MVSENLLLSRIDITKTNVDKTFRAEARLDPVELLDLTGNSKQEGDGAAVDVSALCGLWSVNVLSEGAKRHLVSCAVAFHTNLAQSTSGQTSTANLELTA